MTGKGEAAAAKHPHDYCMRFNCMRSDCMHFCFIRFALCALLFAAVPMLAASQPLDAQHSRFGFELRTRWGQTLEGHFPRYEGEVSDLAHGRRQVRIRLATDSVEVDGPARYTRFARSERFLDAANHPWMEFQSDPYPPELVRTGGPLQGTLRLHGVSRRETFVLAPSECPRPARECDVVALGTIRRSDYGLQSWRWALADDVRFHLRVRLQGPTP